MFTKYIKQIDCKRSIECLSCLQLQWSLAVAGQIQVANDCFAGDSDLQSRGIESLRVVRVNGFAHIPWEDASDFPSFRTKETPSETVGEGSFLDPFSIFQEGMLSEILDRMSFWRPWKTGPELHLSNMGQSFNV